SGGEALRILSGRHFDVVFLDVRMPGLDGLALAAVLGRFADPPALVFVSAYEDGAVGAFELDLHPLDYLMKPVSRVRVEQALARVRQDSSAAAAGGGPQAATSGGTASLPPGMSDEIIPVEHQRGGATRLLQRSTILYLRA